MRWLETLLGRIGPDDAPITPTGDPERVRAVEDVLARARPLVEADGGDIRLVAVTDEGDVVLRLRGACATCARSAETVHGALEPEFRRRFDWFRSVRRG